MSFDYNQAKQKSEDTHGNSWTAYSDLFMMLSTVFLLLYVSVSVRSQTSGIEVHQRVKQLAAQNADLEQQIQVYNTLRDNHLKQSASEQEAEVYQKLMSKLDLLQEEAKDEKNQLRKQAKENEQKEYALNEYQKLIRNIINTNVLSKTQLQKRDVIIDKKDTITREQKVVIENQDQQIEQLNTDIAQNKQKIQRAQKELQRKIAALREQEEEAEITKSEMNKKIAALRANSQKMVKSLEQQNQEAMAELKAVQSNLAVAQQDAQSKGEALVKTQQELAGTKAGYEEKMNELKGQFAGREALLKGEFEAKLAKEKLSGAQRAKALAEFEGQARAREAALQGQLGELSSKIGAAEGKASKAEAERGRALAAVEGLKKENEGLSSDLKRAQELANARNELSKRIKGELKRAGLSGTVDGKTGDVTLAFGEEYFDTGSSDLKPSMMTTLQKFMPGYSKSLFSDEKIAQNIENVEIVGFASSTFKGKYVPPDSLKPEDREAINYNLKLSFNRANAIFKHIFDTKKMSFEHQRDLLPKIKVVGRGYLPEGKSGKDFPTAGMPESQFCSKFNCKQAQKVIIKFKLKD
jgi:myosin heavy subunit